MVTDDGLKFGFPPVVSDGIGILMLGSLPSDASIARGEYYGHPRNRFWPVMAAVCGESPASEYAGKLAMLGRCGIGMWDVLHAARRDGALDANIIDEKPNDLAQLILRHRNLRLVGLNGRKAESSFDRYFRRADFPSLRFVYLPSTSPANAGFGLDRLVTIWREALTAPR